MMLHRGNSRCLRMLILFCMSELRDRIHRDPKQPRLAGRIFVGGSIRKGGPVKVRSPCCASLALPSPGGLGVWHIIDTPGHPSGCCAALA